MEKDKDNKKVKITLQSAGGDVIGGVLTGVGVVGATVVMKQASKANVNPWLVSIISLLLGMAIKVASNAVDKKEIKEAIKDASSGFIAAGSLDLAVKVLAKFAPGLLATLPAGTVPALSGPVRGFKGLRGPAPSSRLLMGPGDAFKRPTVNSRTLAI